MQKLKKQLSTFYFPCLPAGRLLSTRLAKQSGVTLLELLVSVSMFAAVISIVVAIFISMSVSQKRSASAIDIDNTAYVTLESMAKEIRTGSDFEFPEMAGTGFSDINIGNITCLWGSINTSCNVLRFINYRGQIVIYRLNDAVGVIERLCVSDASWDGDGDGSPDGGNDDGLIDAGERDCFSNTTTHAFSRVTPINTMRVSDLRFNLEGQNYGGNPDRKQSKVIIVLKAETPAGTPVASRRDIILQTVISSRGPDS